MTIFFAAYFVMTNSTLSSGRQISIEAAVVMNGKGWTTLPDWSLLEYAVGAAVGQERCQTKCASVRETCPANKHCPAASVYCSAHTHRRQLLANASIRCRFYLKSLETPVVDWTPKAFALGWMHHNYGHQIIVAHYINAKDDFHGNEYIVKLNGVFNMKIHRTAEEKAPKRQPPPPLKKKEKKSRLDLHLLTRSEFYRKLYEVSNKAIKYESE